jgi:hypothetical protein
MDSESTPDGSSSSHPCWEGLGNGGLLVNTAVDLDF